MLYNNQSAYTTALIVPNKEKLAAIVKAQGLTMDSEEGKKAAIAEIEKEVNAFKKGGEHAALFPDRWLPSTFAILPEPFTEQNQMINSTMKMVRGKIEKAYAARIDHLYTAEGKQILNPENIKSLG
jgi:long-chain acyl-CoA synthetase